MITLQERVHAAPKPDDWQLDKLQQVFRVRRGNKNTGMKEDNLLSLSYGRIVQKDIETADGLLPENFEGYQIVEPGNIVLRLTDLQNDKRSLRQGLVTQRGIITSAYDAVEIQRDNDPRFWFYSLLALDLAKHYYSLGGGVRQSVKFADFPNDWVYRPDLATQRQIADFLDRETARIDLLIEKKQRLVALLGEKKSTAICDLLSASSQGATNKKRSRLPWELELPAEWQEQTLKQMAQVIDCKHTTPVYVDDGYPLISTGEVKPYSISFVSNRQVSKDDYKNMIGGGRKPEHVDIIYSRNASVGSAAMVRDLDPFCMGQDICLIRPNGIDPQFLEHQLNSKILLLQLEPLLVGSTLKRINVNQIKNFRIIVPPRNVQRAIASEIDQLRERTRRTTNAALQSIDRLKEYRSALITAAVTGQIDVSTYAKSDTPDRRLDAIQEEMGA